LGGGQGHSGAGFSGRGAHAATIRIRTTRMWLIYLEVALALGLAAFIVWFTWPRKKK